jgi:hypothetical protein
MRSARKRALVVKPHLGNNFGALNSVIDSITNELQGRFYFLTIDIEDSELITELSCVGSDKSNVIFWTYFGYDLKFSAFNVTQSRSLSSILSARQVVIVDDPPYYGFMYERLKQFIHDTPTNGQIIFSSATAFEEAKALFDIQQPCSVLEFPALVRDEKRFYLPFQNREYDLIAPVSFHEDIHLETVIASFRSFGQLGDFLISSTLNVINDYAKYRKSSSLHLMISSLDSLKLPSTDISFLIKNSSAFRQCVELFDLLRRNAHRASVLTDLITSSNPRILLFGNIPSNILKLTDNITLSDRVPIEILISLIQRSKYLLDVHIPGQNSNHQRAKSALALGTGLMTDGPLADHPTSGSFCWNLNEVSSAVYNEEYSVEWSKRVSLAISMKDLYSTRSFGNNLYSCLIELDQQT